jgi:hypothetical protein
MRKTIIACTATALLVGGGTAATASSLINGSQIKNGTLTSADVKNGSLRGADLKKGTVTMKRLSPSVRRILKRAGAQSGGGTQVGPQGPAGTNGTNGINGTNGTNGAPGTPAETRISTFGGAFVSYLDDVHMTADGVTYGPYADGGADGGGIIYHGLDGQPLSAIRGLAYRMRYSADTDTSGVGSPYLRVFLNDNADDVSFTPNTQSNPDITQGEFHTWVPTQGTVRYDDDAGSDQGEYGSTGAPWATVAGDHGDDVISGIRINLGYSNGANLTGLLRSFEVNGSTFRFGS